MRPLAFIGMSGVGKSTWSSLLAERGFTRICCDELIANELRSELTRADGSLMSVGEWMGFPSDPYYKAREQRYLNLEIKVMQHALAKSQGLGRVVIDTTGSVIYTGADLLIKLRESARIVYFEMPGEIREEKCRKYFANPAPILWRDMFQPKEGESARDAMTRCYPLLVESRVVAYEALADVRIGYWECRASGFTVEDLLRRVG